MKTTTEPQPDVNPTPSDPEADAVSHEAEERDDDAAEREVGDDAVRNDAADEPSAWARLLSEPSTLTWALVLTGVTAGAVVGVILGLPPAALLFCALLLLGAVLLLWTSVRTLLGEDVSGVSLEDEHFRIKASDPLLERKNAVLAALRDMERERALGKIEEEDYQEIVGRLRKEAKVILRRLDAKVAPHRAKAEKIAQAHLREVDAHLHGTGKKAGPAAETTEETPHDASR